MEYRKLYIYEDTLDLWENLIRVHLTFKKIKLPDQTIKVFSYFCAYGINNDTFKRLIDDKVVKDRQVLYNSRTLLKDKGFLKMIRQSVWEVEEPFNSPINKELSFLVRCKTKE